MDRLCRSHLIPFRFRRLSGPWNINAGCQRKLSSTWVQMVVPSATRSGLAAVQCPMKNERRCLVPPKAGISLSTGALQSGLRGPRIGKELEHCTGASFNRQAAGPALAGMVEAVWKRRDSHSLLPGDDAVH